MGRMDGPKKSGDSAPAIPANLPRLSSTVVFEGDFSSTEDLLIQGQFKGSLRLQNANLYIDRKARVEATVSAGNVYVYGTLIGPIQATGCVFLSAEADMKGDIAAARLFVEDGARFRGGVQTIQTKSE
jgi:cytoskeletal protein CcmA (bactofilin family)